MFTKTTLSALRMLTLLGLREEAGPHSPRALAETIRESPTYLAKVVRLLVRAGIGCSGGWRGAWC